MKPSEIFTDPQVQRSLVNSHAEKIAKDYDPLLFGLGHVSLRSNGRYYALDGQHRCAAAVIAGKGDSTVMFKVYRGLSEQDEAELFVRLNANKKAVAAIDTFRLCVKAGHPVHNDIVRIIESFGLRIALHHAEGGIGAVNALLQIYEGKMPIKTKAPFTADLPKGHLLSRTLHILTTAWGKDRDAFDATLLRGVAALLYKHGPELDAQRLAKMIAKAGTPVTVMGAIRGLQSLTRKSSANAAIEHLEGLYLRGRGRQAKLSQVSQEEQ